MTTTFNRAFEIVIGHEGGYTNDPRDTGNWTGGAVNSGELKGTKYGISAASYPLFDIANLTLDDARAIYKRDYWDKVGADDLAPPLAMLVFDAAVNSGVGRACQWLRVSGADTDDACVEFMAQRINFMGGLKAWPTYGLGWSRRLARIPYEAMAMEDPNEDENNA